MSDGRVASPVSTRTDGASPIASGRVTPRSVAFFFLLLFAASVPLEAIAHLGPLGSTARIAGIAAAASGAYALCTDLRARPANNTFFAFGAFVAWNAVSYFWSSDPIKTFARVDLPAAGASRLVDLAGGPNVARVCRTDEGVHRGHGIRVRRRDHHPSSGPRRRRPILHRRPERLRRRGGHRHDHGVSRRGDSKLAADQDDVLVVSPARRAGHLHDGIANRRNRARRRDTGHVVRSRGTSARDDSRSLA